MTKYVFLLGLLFCLFGTTVEAGEKQRVSLDKVFDHLAQKEAKQNRAGPSGKLKLSTIARYPKLSAILGNSKSKGYVEAEDITLAYARHVATYRKILGDVDKNRDGYLAYGEVVKYAPALLPHFAVIDSNKDGLLTQKELLKSPIVLSLDPRTKLTGLSSYGISEAELETSRMVELVETMPPEALQNVSAPVTKSAPDDCDVDDCFVIVAPPDYDDDPVGGDIIIIIIVIPPDDVNCGGGVSSIATLKQTCPAPPRCTPEKILERAQCNANAERTFANNIYDCLANPPPISLGGLSACIVLANIEKFFTQLGCSSMYPECG